MSTNRWVNPVGNNLLRDAEGNLLPGGTLEIYEAGTTTPLAVYSDPDQTVSLGSVLTADAYGLIADFHVANGTQFKAVAKDYLGATMWTRDYLFGADSSTDSRLDALEATVNALEGSTYNGLVNGGMRVGLNAAPNLTTSFAEGKVNRVLGRVTNVTAGTLTQGEDTAYASARYCHFSGVSMSASGVVEAQIRVASGEAGSFANDGVVFSCLVRHDVGSAVDYTITVKKPAATADDFSSLTTIATGTATSVTSGVDTRLELPVADLGDCSKGLAIEISAAIGASITTKNFRLTEAQLEVGATRSGFTEGSYEMAEAACKTLGLTLATEAYADAAAAAAVAGSEVIVGRAYSAVSVASGGLTGSIPVDSTIPQASEGDLLIPSVAYAAQSATNIVRITVVLNVYLPSADAVFALFGSHSTNALSASLFDIATGGWGGTVTLRHEYIPGTTSSRNYTVRGGVSSGTYYMNQSPGGDTLGGVFRSSMTIEEIKA